MTLALLADRRVSWDTDAASYITAVEAADGQSLETGIKRAINQFVIDCKVRGIWGAIKSCCLLCGARTLSGALVPLKENAPTNNNFVSADYNRETGLKGNGSNKYLLTNRFENSDPQNNKHLSIFIANTTSSTVANGLIGTGGINGSLIGSNLNGFQLMLNSSTSTSISQTYPRGFFGISRNNSANASVRFNNATNTINSASSATGNTNNIAVLGFMSGLSSSSSRASFYSVGESLDLRLLEQCVDRYNNGLSRAFTSSYVVSDASAAAYISSIELLDKATLTYSYRKGVNDFIVGCKSDNTWNSIQTCCIMIGAKTLDSALYPLVGTAPSNVGFTEFNYNRNLGLSNSSRVGYLNSNRNNNADPQDSQHLAVYAVVAESSSAVEYQYIGAGANDVGTSSISTNINRRSRSSGTGSAAIIASNTFAGISRNNGSSFTDRSNGTTYTLNVASQTPFASNIGVFSRHSGLGITNATLAFYSIGTSVDLVLLENRVATLVGELSATRALL